MILKKLYWSTGLKNESLYYFIIGFLYSLLGIFVSWLIFTQNIGLVAVFLISIAAITQVDKKLSISELILGKTKLVGGKIAYFEEIIIAQRKITLGSVYKDHKNLFKTYLFLFLGIMFCFSAITLILPLDQSTKLFGEQFKIIQGGAFSDSGLLTEILLINLRVLLTGFFLALIFEFGTTFIIVWNASVWGTAFAFASKEALLINSGDPFINFFIIIALVLTYLPFEAAAYFSSTISGGLLNKAILREKISSKRFQLIATHSIILLGFGLVLLSISGLIEVWIIRLIQTFI